MSDSTLRHVFIYDEASSSYVERTFQDIKAGMRFYLQNPGYKIIPAVDGSIPDTDTIWVAAEDAAYTDGAWEVPSNHYVPSKEHS